MKLQNLIPMNRRSIIFQKYFLRYEKNKRSNKLFYELLLNPKKLLFEELERRKYNNLDTADGDLILGEINEENNIETEMKKYLGGSNESKKVIKPILKRKKISKNIFLFDTELRTRRKSIQSNEKEIRKESIPFFKKFSTAESLSTIRKNFNLNNEKEKKVIRLINFPKIFKSVNNIFKNIKGNTKEFYPETVSSLSPISVSKRGNSAKYLLNHNDSALTEILNQYSQKYLEIPKSPFHVKRFSLNINEFYKNKNKINILDEIKKQENLASYGQQTALSQEYIDNLDHVREKSRNITLKMNKYCLSEEDYFKNQKLRFTFLKNKLN